MPSDWKSFADFGCGGATKRWRYVSDGSIEIEAEGAPVGQWPSAVNDWRPLIEASAAANNVPPHWVAAIMAIETGGRNVCLDAANPTRACGPPCNCVPNEGAGLMATLASTATSMMGRPVTSTELLKDPALAVEAGARTLKYHLDRYKGDFVAAAVAYNAGSVKCSSKYGPGSVFVPSGKDWPRQPCPSSLWAVVFACVYSGKSGGICRPSDPGAPLPYICSNDYPHRAIASHNAALHFFSGAPLPVQPVAVAGFGAVAGIVLGLGAIAGYYGPRLVTR